MTGLSEQVALVTGASRGVGRGVALGLALAVARVFATGRSVAHADLGPDVMTITCDHTDDLAVAEVFRRIEETAGRLDILVRTRSTVWQRRRLTKWPRICASVFLLNTSRIANASLAM